MISLVTAAEAQGLDSDMPILVEALAAIGEARRVDVWDDPSVDWASCDLVVVRSTWDYFRDRDRFLRWVDDVASVTLIANRPAVLRWNTDKRYLAELTAAGFDVVPTRFVEPGVEVVAALLGCAPVVVKPAVSAGSNDTARYATGEHDLALAHLRRLVDSGRVAMVQPYQSSVDVAGETGLVYLGGSFSHAFAKAPLLTDSLDMAGGLFAREQIAARSASAAERDLADRAIAFASQRFGPLLYGRVDVVPGPNGPLLLELELAEPSLFLHTDPGAPARAAAALRAARPRL